MIPAAGMVRTHAQTIRPATPHFTAEKRLAEPTPTIEPVMVCVVETGMPKYVAPKSVIAPAVSAQNPPTGCSLTIFVPIVLTIRHPPESVPRAIAAHAATSTQSGMSGSLPPGRHLEKTAGDKGDRDNTHRLLCVVAAVAKAVGRGGKQLTDAENAVDAIHRTR